MTEDYGVRRFSRDGNSLTERQPESARLSTCNVQVASGHVDVTADREVRVQIQGS